MHVRHLLFSLFDVGSCHILQRKERGRKWRNYTRSWNSLLVVTYMHHLFFQVLRSALWRNIFHFVSCLWCCSLGVTLPLWFRSDLSLGRKCSLTARHDDTMAHTPASPEATQRGCLLAQLWWNYGDKCISFHYAYLWFWHVKGQTVSCIFLNKASHIMTFIQKNMHPQLFLLLSNQFHIPSFPFGPSIIYQCFFCAGSLGAGAWPSWHWLTGIIL